jgi:tetratricopeptide (TPR) repeat protein
MRQSEQMNYSVARATRRRRRKTARSWGQIAVSAITSITSIAAVVVAVVALLRTSDVERTRQQLELHQLLAEATDLIYYGDGLASDETQVSDRDLARAAWRISAALEIDRQSVDAQLLASRYFFLISDYDTCLAYATRAGENDPGNTDALLYVAQAQYFLGHYGDALASATEAIDLGRRRSRPVLTGGILLSRTGAVGRVYACV